MSGHRGAWTCAAIVVAILAGVAAILLPAVDLAANGRILFWHVHQTGFIQGGIELATLGVLVWGALSIGTRWANLAALAIVLLYLRRHHVDLPALIALLHLEMLLALGAMAMRRTGHVTGTALSGVLRPFLVGVVAWTLVAVVLSLCGLGRPSDLKIAAIVLMIPAFAFGRSRPLIWRGWLALRDQQGLTRVLGVFALVILLGWLARTNNVTGYDPLWYGLRPQHVLAPDRSFFDVTGLVSPVYYFPKLYELLIAPLSAFRDVSYPFAFGVGLLAITGIALWRFARSLGVGRDIALAGSVATMTIPAIGNTAVSTKTDVIASLLVVLAIAWAWQALRSRRTGDLLWSLSAIALASACKLIVLPYGAALALGVILAGACEKQTRMHRWKAPDRLDWIVFSLAAFAMAAIHARTWWLTGMPTVGPEPLVALWNALGMTLREPVGTLSWMKPQDWNDVPALLHEMLLAPSALPHVIVSWIGNVWLWLLVAASAFFLAAGHNRHARRTPTQAVALLAPIVIVGIYLAIGIGHMSRGGDGNYLIIPIACCMLLGLVAADRAASWTAARTAVLGMLMATSVFQFTYSFANSHWGEPGTRAFDLDFSRTTFDSKHKRDALLARYQVDDIVAALADKPTSYRIVGLLEDSAGFFLPVRFEDIESIVFSRPAYLASTDAFRRFLSVARIDALIVPIPGDGSPVLHDVARAVANELRTDPRAIIVLGMRYELIDITALHDPAIRQGTSD